MIPYLSCDWGTSSFRLSLVDAENFRIIESENSGNGILTTFNQWKETGNTDPGNRLRFYLNIIRHHINSIEIKAGKILEGVPLIISGMASSSIGIKPLPYQELPFFIDGTGIPSEFVSHTSLFKHDILLISGIKSEDDVMRGEETQLIGMFAEDAMIKSDGLYIFPGTHSKHITVKGNQAVSFKTYMTGEFFNLLSRKSILHADLEEDDTLIEGTSKEYFEQAVIAGSESSLLNVCFKVRTNSLFFKLTKKENFHYLSGLLIGAELGEITRNDTITIHLCCGTKLKTYYETALKVLGLKNVYLFNAVSVEKAAMIGQYKIYENHIKR